MGLHRRIYGIIVGLAAWLILSVWGFLGSGYAGLALTVVSLFIGVAVGLALVLALIARRDRRQVYRDGDDPGSLGEWLGREFETQTGRIGGMAAAIQVLLPIAAVAFGMTIFAIAHHFDLGA
jgi:hypothetical protein